MVDYISTVSWCCMQKRGGYSRSKKLLRGINTVQTFIQFQFLVRIQIYIQNPFSLLIRAPGGVI